MGQEYKMEEIAELQKETIESLKEYIPNLQRGLSQVTEELKGERKEDTDEYLRMNIDGLNWVIEAYNGTVSSVDPEKTKIDVASLEEGVEKLSKSFMAKEDAGIAESIEKYMLPFLEQFMNAMA